MHSSVAEAARSATIDSRATRHDLLRVTLLHVDDEIQLKIPDESDAEAMFVLVDANRTHLREWLPWLDTNRSPQDSLAFIRGVRERFHDTGAFQGAIFYQGRLVGMNGFHSIGQGWGAIGYWVAKPYGGKGIATRTSRALIAYGFAKNNLNLVELRAATQNLASRRVAEKLGMKLDGILRQREWLYDHFVDHAVYSVTRAEWK